MYQWYYLICSADKMEEVHQQLLKEEKREDTGTSSKPYSGYTEVIISFVT